MRRLIQFTRSPTSYPVTGTYISGVVLAISVSEGWLELGLGVLLFSILTVIALLAAMLREVRVVHYLVNSQRDELLNRISDLIDALHEADVRVPDQRERGTRADM